MKIPEMTVAAALLALVAVGSASGSDIIEPIGAASRPAPHGTYLQGIDRDLAEAARRFAAGELTGSQYTALVADRAGKARRYLHDATWRKAADQEGDSDGDGVPDSLDRCTTPHLQPTNERGCPAPAPPDCRQGDRRCSGPSLEDDRRTRDLFDQAALLFNPRCDGSPAPQRPVPLEWGRGPQTAAKTWGFNFAVTKVTNQKPGCELFYEIQLRIAGTTPAGQHFVRHVTVLFKATEDLKPADKLRAVYGIPIPAPLSPERDRLRDALSHGADVQWRVRAVNGAQQSSAWSDMRAQGPASGGVDG